MSYDVRPTEAELSEARAIVGVALDACERARPLDGTLRVALGWTDNEPVLADGSGVSGTCYPGGEVELGFNSDVTGWDEALAPETARLYGTAWFTERVDVAFRWQRLLATAFADRFAREVYPDGPTPWRGEDERAAEGRWTEVRDGLGERDDLPEDRTLGRLGADLGEELQRDHDLGAFVELTREAVQEAGARAFE
ncbi:hypothetical protein [Halomarina litorea]|uniref:hypothetical protein n=1 Tax=Halomarina litorea TaxID=2961595 RepID=UPI0020C1C469|nr:hypothetical protein [Halomarina sp. BCD28]